MVMASILFAMMGSLIYQVKIWEPALSSGVTSLFRVGINLAFVVVMSFWVNDSQGKKLGVKGLFGDLRWSLWLRGFFGTLSVVTFFYGVGTIGVGEASFFNSSHVLWMGLLGPMVLRQRTTYLSWIAVISGMIGLYLMYQPSIYQDDHGGRSVAILSGFFGALAYLMISRSGRSNHPLSVVFYFTFLATIVHIIWAVFADFEWPQYSKSWCALFAAGILASIAQNFMTTAYQEAPAAVVSAVSYLSPVISLMISVIVFKDYPTLMSFIGACIILVAGLVLPFVSAMRIQKQRAL